MKHTPFFLATISLVVSACAQRGAPPTAGAPISAPITVGSTTRAAGTVTIWRGVVAKPGGQIDWTKNSFGVSQGTLSFFNAQGNNQPCWLEVTVDAPNVPVQQNQGGTIAVVIPGNVAFKGAQPAASPWAAVFDDANTGHWSITKATTGGTSNNDASFNAAAVFSATWHAPNQAVITIHDGTTANCHG